MLQKRRGFLQLFLAKFGELHHVTIGNLASRPYTRREGTDKTHSYAAPTIRSSARMCEWEATCLKRLPALTSLLRKPSLQLTSVLWRFFEFFLRGRKVFHWVVNVHETTLKLPRTGVWKTCLIERKRGILPSSLKMIQLEISPWIGETLKNIFLRILNNVPIFTVLGVPGPKYLCQRACNLNLPKFTLGLKLVRQSGDLLLGFDRVR